MAWSKGKKKEKKSVYFWSFGVRLRRCEKRHLRKYGQLSRRDSWVGVKVCKWACLLVVVFERHKNQQSATWMREPRPALELREKQRNEGMKWMEWGCRWTHTASGTVTQGKQCSGSHLAETGGGGGSGGEMGRRGQCGGSRGWREGLRWAQAYGKADFSSPRSSKRRQMSAWAASTLDCAALGTTTWLSLLSHRVWAAVTLWSLSPGQRKASWCSSSPTCMHVHQHLLYSLLFFTQRKYKETCLLWQGISLKVLAKEKEKKKNELPYMFDIIKLKQG